MSIFVALHHVTHYKYDRPVALGPQIIRLRPAPHCRTASELFAQGHAAEPFRQLAAGPARQLAGALCLPGKDRRNSGSRSISPPRLAVINPFDFFVEPYAEEFSVRLCADESHDRTRRLSGDRRARRPAARRILRGPDSARSRPARSIFWSISTRSCRKKIHYVIRMEPGVQTPDETLALGVGLLPRFRLAAGADPAPSRSRRAFRLRLSDPAQRADVDPLEGPQGPDHDFTDLHAWAEVYLPGAGWIGFDATSGLFCRRGPSAALRHAALPLGRADLGRRRAGACRIRLRDAGRAHPRSAARHRALFRRGLGAARRGWASGSIADLRDQDVRLTMGGEPTFVSIDDFECAGMEHRGGRPDQARARRRSDPTACTSASRPAASCITARANGIRAKACRAGPSRSIGARTASRSGATRR